MSPIPPSPPIRGLVFDLYGTLVTRGAGPRAYREVINAMPPWNWLRARRAMLTQPIATISEFHAHFGVRRGPQPAHYERLVREGLDAVELYPDSVPTLERARERGLRLALLSNLAAPYKRPVYDFELDARFDAVVFSCDVGLAKPDARIYELVSARLGLATEALVMIGDTRRDDVRGARAAGLHALHIDRGGRGGDIHSFEQLWRHPLLREA